MIAKAYKLGLVILGVTIAYGASAQVRPVPPANLTVDGVGSPSAPYDLGAFPQGWPQPVWPNPPNITDTITVTTVEELRNAAVDGTHVILTAGIYDVNELVLDRASDIRMTFSPGAQVNGNISINSANRLHFVGPSARPSLAFPQVVNGAIQGTPSTDILIEKMAIDVGEGSPFGTMTQNQFVRFAMIESRVDARDGYAFFSFQSNGTSSDLILAGNYLVSDGTQACTRIMDARRVAYIENRIQTNGGNKRTLRLHIQDDYVHVARNLFARSYSSIGTHEVPPGAINSSWVDNEWWIDDDRFNAWRDDGVEWAPVVLASGNVYYHIVGMTGASWFPESKPGWTLSNNAYGGPWPLPNIPEENPYW